MKLKHKDPHLHYIAITAIIRKNGKYLITKRSSKEKAFPNTWTVPGGRLDVREYMNLPKTKFAAWYGTVEQSLRREVKEEVNLEIKNINLVIDMTFVRPDGIPVVVLSFCADYKSGKIKLDDDSVDYKWVTAKEARQYELISGIEEEITLADKFFKNKRTRLKIDQL